MTGLVKGILISTAVVVVIIVIIVGVGIYWVATNGPALVEKSKQSLAEGQEFAKNTDNQGCLNESLTRHRADPSMGGAIKTQLFLTACLPLSRETPNFCKDVPKKLEFMRSAQWQTQRCLSENLRDSYCPQIFAQVQSFCEMREAKKSGN